MTPALTVVAACSETALPPAKAPRAICTGPPAPPSASAMQRSAIAFSELFDTTSTETLLAATAAAALDEESPTIGAGCDGGGHGGPTLGAALGGGGGQLGDPTEYPYMLNYGSLGVTPT